MEAQLHLLPTEDDAEISWRLDDATRAIGRRGVADARGALRAALRHRAEGLLDDDEEGGRSDHAAVARQASAA
jgi:hypothetical protein